MVLMEYPADVIASPVSEESRAAGGHRDLDADGERRGQEDRGTRDTHDSRQQSPSSTVVSVPEASQNQLGTRELECDASSSLLPSLLQTAQSHFPGRPVEQVL